MVKKRSIKKNKFSTSKNLNKKISNPFNINPAIDFFKNIKFDEKTLLISLLGVIAIVAFTTNWEGIKTITGASFTPITGEPIGVDTTTSDAIVDVFNLLLGFLDPIFKLFGSSEVIVFRVILAVILYMVLAFGLGLRNKLEGKGKIIAGLLAVFIAAIMKEDLIKMVVGPIHIMIIVLSTIAVALFLLWMLHKWEPESSAAHLTKAMSYFILFMFIAKSRADLTTAVPLPSTGFTGLTPILNISMAFLLLYTIIMVFLEVFRAIGRRGESPRAGSARRGLESLIGTPGERRARRERNEQTREETDRGNDELRGLGRDALEALEDVM